MLLTDEYAPKNLSMMLGNSETLERVRQWMLQWISGKKRAPLLVWGPTGVGKTTVPYALASEYDLDVLEMSASDLRDKGRIEKLTRGAGLAGGLFGNLRLILIDYVDMLAGRKDSGGGSAIGALLKENPCPIILTASDIWDKKLSALRSECEPIELKRIARPTIRKRIGQIAAEKRMDLGEELLDSIAMNAEGDMRSALNDLQRMGPSARDREKDIFQTVRSVLKADTYKEAREAARGDIDYEFLKLWIDENIPHEYTDPGDLRRAYWALSLADIFDGRIKRSRWQLMRYSVDLATAGVALAKAAPYRKFTRYAFPTYLKGMARTVARRAMLKSIGLKIGARLHVDRRQALDYLPLIKDMCQSGSERIAAFYGLDEDETAFIMETSAKKVARSRKKA